MRVERRSDSSNRHLPGARLPRETRAQEVGRTSVRTVDSKVFVPTCRNANKKPGLFFFFFFENLSIVLQTAVMTPPQFSPRTLPPPRRLRGLSLYDSS